MLNNEDKNTVVDRYSKRYKEFGYSPKTLGWDKGKQGLRFSVLTSGFMLDNASIVDIGCGFGDLYQFLGKKFKGFKYTGVDIVESLIDEGRKRYSGENVEFRHLDFLDEAFQQKADYCIASGIFNFKLEYQSNYDYIEQVITKAFDCCSSGCSFDFLSDKVDFKYPHTFHSSPERLLSMAYRLSRNVILRNDYMPFEFTLIIYKDDSFEKEDTIFNYFKKSSNYY